MKTFQLIEKNGYLHFPHGGNDMDRYGPESYNRPELPSILFKRYEGGDCDTCPWPMVPASYSDNTVEDLRAYLAAALYDERESNACWPNEPVIILLPDGERFDFDDVLAEKILNNSTVTWTMAEDIHQADE
jgi:hypothetical protein